MPSDLSMALTTGFEPVVPCSTPPFQDGGINRSPKSAFTVIIIHQNSAALKNRCIPKRGLITLTSPLHHFYQMLLAAS